MIAVARRRRLRALAFALLAVWIVGAPFYRQVLGGRSPLLHAWRMYHLRGLDTVEVRFERALPDGDRVAVDRLAVLGVRPADATRKQRLLTGRDALKAAARALCARLGAGVDLRAHARISVPRGWEVVEDGDRDLCARTRP